jgi:hypothetical protein
VAEQQQLVINEEMLRAARDIVFNMRQRFIW